MARETLTAAQLCQWLTDRVNELLDAAPDDRCTVHQPVRLVGADSDGCNWDVTGFLAGGFDPTQVVPAFRRAVGEARSQFNLP